MWVYLHPVVGELSHGIFNGTCNCLCDQILGTVYAPPAYFCVSFPFSFSAGGVGFLGGPLIALIAAGGGALLGTAIGTAGGYLHRKRLIVPKPKLVPNPQVPPPEGRRDSSDRVSEINMMGLGIFDLRINENDSFVLVSYDEDPSVQYKVTDVENPHAMLGHLYDSSNISHDWGLVDDIDDDGDLNRDVNANSFSF